MTVKKLWEYDHPYYCSESNSNSTEPAPAFDSWAAFLEEYGDADMDYNLVFRFDWIEASYEMYCGSVEDPVPEEKYVPATAELMVFIMQQRRGHFVPVSVQVTRADEPAVRAWLAPRWEYLKLVWGGLAEQADSPPTT